MTAFRCRWAATPWQHGWTRSVDDAAGLVDLVRSGVKDVAAGWTVDSVGKAVGNVAQQLPGAHPSPWRHCSKAAIKTVR